MRFYCTSTGPIGGLNCEVLLYLNWSHRRSQLKGHTAYRISQTAGNSHSWVLPSHGIFSPQSFRMDEGKLCYSLACSDPVFSILWTDEALSLLRRKVDINFCFM